MSTKIFVEGGGNRKTTLSQCRKGFDEYCAKLTSRNRYDIVSCGGRDEAFKKFRIAVTNSRPGETVALLVDAEGPVLPGSSVGHLSRRDPSWVFPELKGHKVFLMVQAMEAWFLADREALQAFYGKGFLINSLPGSSTNIESILKQDLEPKLNHACRPTKKGEYHKIEHGFALLALIDPGKVEAGSTHAAEFHGFLRGL